MENQVPSTEEYENTLVALEKLCDRDDFQNKQELIDEAKEMLQLIKNYEKIHFPLPKADPREIEKLRKLYYNED